MQSIAYLTFNDQLNQKLGDCESDYSGHTVRFWFTNKNQFIRVS